MNSITPQIINSINIAVKQINTAIAPLLQKISALVAMKIKENFFEGGRTDGSTSGITVFSGGNTRWKDVSPKTLAAYQRAKNKYSRVGTLQRSGRLMQSIEVSPFGNAGVQITAGTPYAAAHQFGTEHLPARPFITLTPEDLEQITDMVALYVTTGK